MTERLIKTGKWSEKSLNIAAGVQRQIKAAFPVNVVMLHNESITDYIYMGFNDNISELNYETRIAPGQWGVLARPYEFISYFVFAANNISNVKHVEAKVEDPLGFVQRIIYGGQITEGIITSTVGLKAGELNLEAVTKNLFTKVVKGKVYKKVVAEAAEVKTVKDGPGVVFQLAVEDEITVKIMDNETQAWKAGDVTFPEGLRCAEKILLDFSAAGTAYILYE